MEYLTDKNKRTGLIGTAIFHALLLLLFLLFGLTEPFPKPEEMGMPLKIKLGTTATGSGNKPANDVAVEPVEVSASKPEATSVPTPTTSPDIVTQTQETIAITKTKDKDPKPEPKKSKPVKPELTEEEKQIRNHRNNVLAMAQAALKSGGNSGDDKTPGNKGRIDGFPDGVALEGGKTDGSGTGSGRSNRKPLAQPRPKGQCPVANYQEKIVVAVTVNRTGNVIRAKVGLKGSSTSDACLLNSIEEALLKWKYEPDLKAPHEEVITFTYWYSPQ